jgi:protein ImuA
MADKLQTSGKIAALRQSLATYGLERGGAQSAPLGHVDADAVIGGGLRIGALHEVYASDPVHAASACAFASGLALRLGGKKILVWVATDFGSLEFGTPYGNGFLELGLDPERLILLCMSNGEDALRAATDILACRGVGALVIEISRSLKILDLTTSRRLSLAAAQNCTSAILLRLGAKPEASAAETRWLVHAATSPPPRDGDWGIPRFDVQLLRNRHGDLGNWEMEWDFGNGLFRQPDNTNSAPHHGDLVATHFNGSPAAQTGFQLAT